jgi:hypothetical protein
MSGKGNMKHIKSLCSNCGGSIEFPAHGLGELIDCPHCAEQIKLSRPKPNFTRVFVLTCLVLVALSSIPIFDKISESKRRDAIAAAREAEQRKADQVKIDAEMRQNLHDWGLDEAGKANMAKFLAQKAAAQQDTPETIRQKSAILSELRRANDIADEQTRIASDAAFNQRLEAINQSFQNQQAIDEIRGIRLDNEINDFKNALKPQSQPLVLKYNQALQRWELVPQ